MNTFELLLSRSSCSKMTLGHLMLWLSILGCARSEAPVARRDVFSIAVENGTDSEIPHAVIRFEKSKWRTDVGILGLRAFKQTAPEPGMPTIPDTAILSWEDAAGVKHEASVELTGEGRVSGPGEYESVTFLIEEPDSARVFWKRY